MTTTPETRLQESDDLTVRFLNSLSACRKGMDKSVLRGIANQYTELRSLLGERDAEIGRLKAIESAARELHRNAVQIFREHPPARRMVLESDFQNLNEKLWPPATSKTSNDAQ